MDRTAKSVDAGDWERTGYSQTLAMEHWSSLRRHSLPLALAAGTFLFLVAAARYPGGSQRDATAPGFAWADNYVSNLFPATAVNGAPNASRPWAILATALLSFAFGRFFVGFARKMPAPGAARVVRWCGVGSVVFAALAVTPYHDAMVTLSAVLGLLGMFYVTVFVFKSNLHALKVLSVVCISLWYGCAYVYFTRSGLASLPILQKMALGVAITWALAVDYRVRAEDFASGPGSPALKGAGPS